MADALLPGYLLSDDLMFASRITATARSLGLLVRMVRNSADLLALAKEQPPACVLLDLANPGLVVAEVVRQLRSAGETRPFIVAYGSHVDAAGLHAAREAGCDLVLPRSKFVEVLPQALLTWFAGKSH